MNGSKELSCVIKNYVISYDLNSPTGPILHKRNRCKLWPGIVQASFRKDFWFLTKISPEIYVPRVTNGTKTSVLVFSAEFFLKHLDIERFTDMREYVISIVLSVFDH